MSAIPSEVTRLVVKGDQLECAIGLGEYAASLGEGCLMDRGVGVEASAIVGLALVEYAARRLNAPVGPAMLRALAMIENAMRIDVVNGPEGLN